MPKLLPWLTLVGIHENGVDGLSAEACRRIAAAALVVGGKRHLELAAPLIHGKSLPWPSPLHLAIPEIIAAKPQPVCVLCTGDPFHYGMGAVLARHIPIEEMHVLPAPSIISLVCARLGWAIQETVVVALNGRPLPRILPHIQPNAQLIALSADETTPAKLSAMLTEQGLGECELTLIEHLGGAQERVRTCTAADFALNDVARLNCIGITVPETLKPHTLPTTSGIADDWFEHDGQLTKREIRAVTLSALAMRRGEWLWDIGLGAGSIAIEWLLRDPANRAIGFEKTPERAARAARNALKLGIPQLIILEGEAPAVLEGLDAPDAIFIGGGAANTGMIDSAWSVLKPGGRLVINAISLETEALLLAAHKRYGGDMIRIGIERADAVSANMSGWRPAMTVTQWSATK